jgi:hypothetical protein
LDRRRGHWQREKGPLFRSFKRGDKLTGNPMIRSDVLYMITSAAMIGPDDQAFHCDLDFHTQGVNAKPPPPERLDIAPSLNAFPVLDDRGRKVGIGEESAALPCAGTYSVRLLRACSRVWKASTT